MTRRGARDAVARARCTDTKIRSTVRRMRERRRCVLNYYELIFACVSVFSSESKCGVPNQRRRCCRRDKMECHAQVCGFRCLPPAPDCDTSFWVAVHPNECLNVKYRFCKGQVYLSYRPQIRLCTAEAGQRFHSSLRRLHNKNQTKNMYERNKKKEIRCDSFASIFKRVTFYNFSSRQIFEFQSTRNFKYFRFSNFRIIWNHRTFEIRIFEYWRFSNFWIFERSNRNSIFLVPWFD